MISVEVYWHAVKHRSHTLTSVVYVVLHISLFTAKRATGVSKKEGTNKTYVCHILLQRRITPKWNLLKLYPGKSSGSQAWESQPCDGGKAHQGWRDDKLHHLHVDPPPSPTHQRWAKSLTHKRRREKFFSEAARRWGGGGKTQTARGRMRQWSEAIVGEIRWGGGGGGRLCTACHRGRTRALCTHGVLGAVRQVWLRLDPSRDWSRGFRWSSREVPGIIGKMSDRHKIGWWNIIRKPFVIRGEPGSLRGVVSLKWSHPSPQLHTWLGHESLLKGRRGIVLAWFAHQS